MRDAIIRHLGLSSVPDGFLLVTDPTRNLEQLIEQIRPALVVIDSLRAFKPEVTGKNTDAGRWLNGLRRLAREYDCAFLIVHHLRKPHGDFMPPTLQDDTVNTWLDQMEGPKAFTNQTDTRIAIEALRTPDGDGLRIRWNGRLAGDSPLVDLERVYDADGEPLGYRHPTGIECLSKEHQQAYKALPDMFRFSDARKALGRTDKPTNDFLKECLSRKVLCKLPGKQGYRKVQAGSAEPPDVPGKG